MELSTFIWMFVVLKIPILAALWLIWWAVKEPRPADSDEDEGGGTRRPERPRHPRTPPRPPRRGPQHGTPLPAPPRVRTRAVGPRVGAGG